MNLRDLKYLVALSELHHFGKAADACFVSQPTLSTQIKKLEDELGVILIERNNKNVILTDIGLQIVNKAKQTLQCVDDMMTLSSQHNDPEAGRFRLGVIPTLAPYLLPEIMPGIQKRFPKLKIYLFEFQTSLILEKLSNAELDAALLALPVEETNLKTQSLFIEPFFAAIASNHSLAQKSSINLEELRDNDILLLEDGHCLRDQSLDLCKKMGRPENDGYRATSLETLRQMIANSNNATFMPALATKQVTHGDKGIKYIPFSKPQPHRSVAICYRTSSHREQLVLEIGEIIKSRVSNILS